MNKFLTLILCLLISINTSSAVLMTDSFVEDSLRNKDLEKPATNIIYDYSNTDSVKIPLRITERITTAKINKAHEGQILNFTVDKNVYYKNNLLVKKGTHVSARLEIITTRGFAGVPAEIFITDFKIPSLDSHKIKEPVSKKGISTTEFILPIKWALTPFPPFGSLTNIMVGFNASLSPLNTIDIYYYPELKY